MSVTDLRNEAVRFEHGEGVEKDAFRAIDLYCEAARRGDADAQYSLGWMYLNARGVERSDALAALFFGLAAEQGHAQAAEVLHRLGTRSDELPECMRDQQPLAYDGAPPLDLISAEERASGTGEFEFTLRATSPAQQKIFSLVQSIAPEYNVSPLLALAFIRAESNFDPRATSHKNAQGLMQLIPETSARFNVKKPYDPVQNIRGGLSYIRWLLAYFRGQVPLVAAAYNAGEKTVEKYRGIPPYAETRDYVKRIMSVFRHSQHPFDSGVTDPSPELNRMTVLKQSSG